MLTGKMVSLCILSLSLYRLSDSDVEAFVGGIVPVVNFEHSCSVFFK